MNSWYIVTLNRYTGGSQASLHYATKSMSLGASHDILAGKFVEGRVADPGVIGSWLWGERATRGPRELQHGSLVLFNADGALDGFIGYAMHECLVRIRRYTDADPNNGTDVFIGSAEQVEVDEKTVTVLFREPAFVLQRSIFSHYYLGDNALPAGLEGNADLLGKPKPRIFGYCKNVKPVLVNSSRLVYQASVDTLRLDNTPALRPFSVYDKRVALTAGVARTIAQMQAGDSTQSVTSTSATTDLMLVASTSAHVSGDVVTLTNPPAASPAISTSTYYYVGVADGTHYSLHTNQADALTGANKVNLTNTGGSTATLHFNLTLPGVYDWCNSSDATYPGFFVRLGSAPVGDVTMDLEQPCHYSAGVMNTTTPSGVDYVLQAIIEDAKPGTSLAGTPASGAGIYEVGAYLDSEITTLEVAETVAASIGLSWRIDATYTPPATTVWTIHLFQMLYNQITGTPDLELTEDEILMDGDGPDAHMALRRVVSQDDDRGIPVHQVTVQYARCWTVQQLADLAGATTADQAFCVNEYRTEIGTNPGTLSTYPYSPDVTITTLLKTQTDAQNFAINVINLLATLRDMIEVDVHMDTLGDVGLADKVKVTVPRFGYGSGKSFRVIGAEYHLAEEVVTLTLWG
jgi:hypothetical protein